MKKIELSELIKTAREKEGISQRELARRIKMDNAEISRIEKGTRLKPNLLVLNNLSKELKISFIALVEAAKYNETEIQELKAKISKSYQQLLEDEDNDYWNLKSKMLILLEKFKNNEIEKEEFIKSATNLCD